MTPRNLNRNIGAQPVESGRVKNESEALPLLSDRLLFARKSNVSRRLYSLLAPNPPWLASARGSIGEAKGETETRC